MWRHIPTQVPATTSRCGKLLRVDRLLIESGLGSHPDDRHDSDSDESGAGHKSWWSPRLQDQFCSTAGGLDRDCALRSGHGHRLAGGCLPADLGDGSRRPRLSNWASIGTRASHVQGFDAPPRPRSRSMSRCCLDGVTSVNSMPQRTPYRHRPSSTSTSAWRPHSHRIGTPPTTGQRSRATTSPGSPDSPVVDEHGRCARLTARRAGCPMGPVRRSVEEVDGGRR